MQDRMQRAEAHRADLNEDLAQTIAAQTERDAPGVADIPSNGHEGAGVLGNSDDHLGLDRLVAQPGFDHRPRHPVYHA